MPTIRELVKKRLSDKQDVLRATPGILGDISGAVAVPGRPNYVYVRLMGVAGDAPAEVYNNRVANLANLPVLVGYDPLQPNLLQVLSTRAISRQGEDDKSSPSGVQPHHLSHEYPTGSDIVWVQLMQFLPFRVFPAGGLSISVYRGVVYAGGAWRKLEETVTHDLASYVPTTNGKACFVLVTLDNSATVTFTKGSEVNLADLAGTDIPAAPAGTSLVLAAIRLYAGQTAINESTTNLDIYDLRWPPYGEAQGLQHGAVTLAASADAILGLSGQEISADSQTANKVLAGPTSGAAAAPTFRSLVVADIPTHTLIMSLEDLENVAESGEATGDILYLGDWMEYPGGSESKFNSALLTTASSDTTANLYDSNKTNQWLSLNPGPHWTTFAFDRKRFVSKIVITANAGDWMGFDYPDDIYIYGSNTGAFGGEETQMAHYVPSDQGVYTITFPSPRTGYRYYKITFGRANHNCRVNELEIYTMTDEAVWVNKTLAGAGIAAASHTHSANDITSGIMSQDRLGTGSGGAGTKYLADDQTWKTPTGGGDGRHAVVGILSGNLAVGSGLIRLYNHFGRALTITAVYAAVATPPTGQAAIFDINLEGATIFTTQSHRPQIAADQYEGSASAIDVTNWPDGYYITIDVDQIGSGNPGSNATITIVCE